MVMAEKNSIQNLQFSFDIADSRQLSGTCSFAASGGEKRPAAIILHGFKGNSEWGFFLSSEKFLPKTDIWRFRIIIP